MPRRVAAASGGGGQPCETSTPVYTPPELRGRGFAGAVTAAVSRDALDAGAERVRLFADLANPTSNALYQRLGYRPLAGFVDLDST